MNGKEMKEWIDERKMNEWTDDGKMNEKSYDEAPMKEWRNQLMRGQWMKEWPDDRTCINDVTKSGIG